MERRDSASALSRTLRIVGPFVGLALVVAFFAAASGDPARYLSAGNLRIVLTQTVIVALGAIGMTVIIVSGGIDLSVGSVVALASVVAAIALRASWPPAAALLAGVLSGGLVGLVNGLAITRLRVVPFIATLGMLGIARGAAKWVAGEQTVNIPATWLNELATTSPSRAWLLVAPGVWIAVVLAVLAAVVIGGGSLSGGEGSILGSMIGALIMAFLRNGCQLMGWPNYIQEIIIGVIIVLAVAADRVRAARLQAKP